MIDAMTLAEAGEIFTYWERNPPTHLIVQTIARLLGWTPRLGSPGPPRIEEIAASAPPGLVVASGDTIDLPAPVFDSQVLRARNQARAAEIAQRYRDGGVSPLPRVPGGN